LGKPARPATAQPKAKPGRSPLQRADYARASQQGLPRRSQRRSRAEVPFNERTTPGQASKGRHGDAKRTAPGTGLNKPGRNQGL
jgi:hypothetical protein